MIGLVKKLHWKYLPIFSDNMIVNRGCTVEENLEEFYLHYHPLEDLSKWIKGKKDIIKKKLGDVNLNKMIEVEVYSQRWEHIDKYEITRTIEGWDAKYFMVESSGGPEGEGIIECLEHDYISYPNDIKYCFEELWNKADNTEMVEKELELELKKIINWINIVELSKPTLDDKEDELDRFYKIAKEIIGEKQ